MQTLAENGQSYSLYPKCKPYFPKPQLQQAAGQRQRDTKGSWEPVVNHFVPGMPCCPKPQKQQLTAKRHIGQHLLRIWTQKIVLVEDIGHRVMESHGAPGCLLRVLTPMHSYLLMIRCILYCAPVLHSCTALVYSYHAPQSCTAHLLMAGCILYCTLSMHTGAPPLCNRSNRDWENAAALATSLLSVGGSCAARQATGRWIQAQMDGKQQAHTRNMGT